MIAAETGIPFSALLEEEPDVIATLTELVAERERG